MAEPNITFSVSSNKISAKAGYNVVSVTFSSDMAYKTFECRATKDDSPYGPGIGALIAAFSSTPAFIERTFEIYDEHLTMGDGDYRISFYAETSDSTIFVPIGSSKLITSDNNIFCLQAKEA